MKIYEVWKANRWNDEIKDDLVALFYYKELAEEFINYQATLGNRYVLGDKLCEKQ